MGGFKVRFDKGQHKLSLLGVWPLFGVEVDQTFKIRKMVKPLPQISPVQTDKDGYDLSLRFDQIKSNQRKLIFPGANHERENIVRYRNIKQG